MEINNDDYIGRIGHTYNVLYEMCEDEKGIKYLVQGKNIYVAKIAKDGYDLKNEIEINEIIRTIKSQNIVKFISSGEDIVEEEEKSEYIIFEFCSKGELYKYLHILKGFKEIVVLIIFKQILETVKKIHNKGIYQLNLKIENILIDKDYNIKLGNFGEAKRKKEEQKDYKNKDKKEDKKDEKKEDKKEEKSEHNEGISLGKKGKLYSIDPKAYILIKDKQNVPFYGPETGSYYEFNEDTFDLGIILFHLLTGIDGFNDLKYDKNEFLKKKEKFYLKHIPQKFQKIFLEMISLEDKERPTIKDILNNNLFNDIKDLSYEEQKELIKKQLEDIEISQYQKTVNLSNTMKIESFEEQKYFINTTKIRCIRNENIFDNYIKINGDLIPVQYMNKFANEIENLYGDIKLSKIYFKFNIIIKKGENEEEEEEENLKDENHNSLELGNNNEIENGLNIIVELVKIREKTFLLNFTKGNGSIRDFYLCLKNIMRIAEDLI